MAKPFPNHPNLIGGFAPIQMECDAPDLIVDGEVPRDLNGTFYRNGPNPQFAPRGHHHWFGGDGMVHAFTLDDGRVSYRNRWARTVMTAVPIERRERMKRILGLATIVTLTVALTASGTATVQTALHDVPMVVVYRVSPMTYRLGRRLVKLDTFAMVKLWEYFAWRVAA
jgi:hypothetical protein